MANYGGSIGKYTTSGDPVNPALVTGLPCPIGIALDTNGNVFVSNYGTLANGYIGSIGKYTTSGETVTATLVSGLNWNWGIVANDSGKLFVAFNIPTGKIGCYTLSGAVVRFF